MVQDATPTQPVAADPPPPGRPLANSPTSLEFTVLYDHLRAIAGQLLRVDSRTATLSPTVIVHEAWLRLAGVEGWTDRSHFLALAARSMRHVLVDQARRRQAEKRGGGQNPLTITASTDIAADDAPTRDIDVLILEEALEELERADLRSAQVVTLKFFAGLRIDEIAAATGTTISAVEHDWVFARAFLRRRLDGWR